MIECITIRGSGFERSHFEEVNYGLGVSDEQGNHKLC